MAVCELWLLAGCGCWLAAAAGWLRLLADEDLRERSNAKRGSAVYVSTQTSSYSTVFGIKSFSKSPYKKMPLYRNHYNVVY